MERAAVPGMDPEQKLRQWMNLYADAILKTCFVCLADRAQAEDAAQDTWIKAWRHMDDLRRRNIQNEKAWLLRIAHNLTIDWFRKCGRRSQYEAGSLDDTETAVDPPDRNNEPWRGMHREEVEKAVADAVGKLSPELREVFLLRRENISFKEIAVIQKCSINTVLARMQYALKNLRKSLADWKS